MKLSEYIEKNGDREIKDTKVLEDMLEPEKVKSVWDLEYGYLVYSLYNDGEIGQRTWYPLCCDEEGRLQQGNIFLTRKEAELERDRRAFLTKARRVAGRDGWKPDWKDGEQGKYFWYIDTGYNEVVIEYYYTSFCTCQVYFPSEESIKAFLTEENKAEILRLWGCE